MNSSQITYKDPSVITRHSLEIQDEINLVETISNKLNCNIQVFKNNCLDKEVINNSNYITLDFHINDYPEANIKQMVLVHGDEALVFNNEYMYIHFPFEIDYHLLLEMNNSNSFVEDEYFKSLFQKLKNLDINELHFNVFEQGEDEKLANKKWLEIEEIIQSREYYFKVIF